MEGGPPVPKPWNGGAAATAAEGARKRKVRRRHRRESELRRVAGNPGGMRFEQRTSAARTVPALPETPNMDLVLSSADQRRIAEVVRLCVDPGDDVTAALSEVTRQIVQVTGADKGAFWIPGRPEALHVELGHEPDTFRRYGRVLDEVASPIDLYRRHIDLGVWTRDELWHPYGQTLLRSAYYNEFIVPRRCFDAIGVSVALGQRPHAATVAQVLLHHDSERGRRFGQREMAVLRLLRPALVGIIRTWRASRAETPTGPAGEGPASLECLTAREREITRLLATEGLSNKSIALRLGISVHTTRHHVQAIMAKLGVRSRSQIAPLVHRAARVEVPRAACADGEV